MAESRNSITHSFLCVCLNFREWKSIEKEQKSNKINWKKSINVKNSIGSCPIGASTLPSSSNNSGKCNGNDSTNSSH